MSYRIWIVVVAFVALLAARPLAAVVITQSDGSEFDVTLIAHGGGSYTYQVEQISGKDLSHWVLSLGACMDHIVDLAPTEGLELGHDASTGADGAKWNAPYSGDGPWQFVITLDQEYPIGEITAVVKAGNTHASGTVDGPICDVLPPPDDPQQDPTPTATDQGGTIPPATPTSTPGDNGTIPPATATASPTPTTGSGEPPTATATQQGGTIPPVTPTATQQGGTIPPVTPTATGEGGTIPPVTPTATPTDQGGTIPPVSPTATASPTTPTGTPTTPVATFTPSATPTTPGTPATPTETPTAMPTAHPESRPVQWLPLVFHPCLTNGFTDCGRRR